MLIKYLLFLAVLAETHETMGQTTQLRNLSLKDENSKTIYLGVENKFKISYFAGDIKVESIRLHYKLIGDTLILVPNSVGVHNISFVTKDGPHQVLFTAKRLSDLIVSVGGISNEVIPKEVFLKNRKITINHEDDILEDVVVDSAVISLNERTFQIKGNDISDAVLEAINNDKDVNRLKISYLQLKNVRTGRTFNRTGTITYDLK